MSFMTRALEGKEKLWKIFGAGLIGAALLHLLFPFIGKYAPLIAPFETLIRMVYVGYWFISLWRCAFNVQFKFWGYITRVFVVLLAAAFYALLSLALFCVYGKTSSQFITKTCGWGMS